jgi:hypothetical protein
MGSWKYNSPTFPSTLDAGERCASRSAHYSTREKIPFPIEEKALWTPESPCTVGGEKHILFWPAIEPRSVGRKIRNVVSHSKPSRAPVLSPDTCQCPVCLILTQWIIRKLANLEKITNNTARHYAELR